MPIIVDTEIKYMITDCEKIVIRPLLSVIEVNKTKVVFTDCDDAILFFSSDLEKSVTLCHRRKLIYIFYYRLRRFHSVLSQIW